MTLIGKSFGRWLVVDQSNGAKILCQCECGARKAVWRYTLLDGTSKSCGCLRRELSTPNADGLEDVIRVAAAFCDVSVGELESPRRLRKVAWSRQVVMLLAREFTEASTPQIGMALGGRDHTTVLYGIEEAKARIKENPVYRQIYRDISAVLRQSGFAFRSAA
jgi:hypothetical protein